MTLPVIAITMGDPAGIGPEVTAKALNDRSIYKVCRPIVVGNRAAYPLFAKLSSKHPVKFIDLFSAKSKIQPGIESAASGRASYDYILRAVELVKSGKANSLVTAPISKAALNSAGLRYSGHTELLAKLSNTSDFGMLMCAQDLRAVMVTRHIPLAEVSGKINTENIIASAKLSDKFLQKHMKIAKPRIGICALNPHAGEGGLLGKEEKNIIIPAINQLSKMGVNVTGPLPNDSAWLKMKEGLFDILVVMYHDQVMTPLKCIKPEKIVNITMGLPYIRTSPGHGTAFDIAGKNIANPSSMIEAVKAAARLTI